MSGRAAPPGRGDRSRGAYGSPAGPGGPRGPGGPDDPRRPGGNGRGNGPGGKKKKGKKGRKRKIALISGFVVLLLLFGGVGAGYAAVQVPLPGDVPRAQISTIYYDDGKTVLARIGAENRTDVKIGQISKPMQFAMVSAEDRSFYENSGVSPTGILRAVWSTITGGSVQGGSTITQQYVKNAYLSSEQTVTRKLKEIVLATKADQKYSKDEIMEFYLNTISFGRGSYGIEAASQAFFGIHASQLTWGQAAVLAGLVKSPNGSYDPALHPEAAQKRWDYVMDGLVTLGKISKAERDGTKMPATVPRKKNGYGSGSTGLSGWSGLIVNQVKAELASKGIDQKQLETGGLQIVTTISKKAQEAAVKGQQEVFSDQPKNLAKAVVSVQPGTGQVKAYYGGDSYFDLAAAQHPPGSSFKAYALAEALSQGISIKSVWNGSDNQMFPGERKPVKNSDGESCGNCTLIKATTLSLNTTFYALVAKVGAKKVVDRAGESGIRKIQGNNAYTDFKAPNIRSTALGQYSISVLDQADGFATFAAKGMHAEPYFVQTVKQGGGGLVYQGQPKTNRAFSEDVAADATYAMQTVVDTARHGGLDDGRKSAGKTGTAQYQTTDQNAHAWMCGYTPQLATAVWVGRSGDDGPIKNASGSIIYGSGLPYLTWQATMDGALKGDEEQSLPEPKYIGDDTLGNGHLAPSPNPSGSVSPSPSGGTDGGTGFPGGDPNNPSPTPTRGGGIFTGGPGQ